MLGHIMSIIIFLIGIFEGIFSEIYGLYLSGAMIVYWILGMIWDKSNHNKWFWEWKEFFKLFKVSQSNDAENTVKENSQ